MVKEWANQEIRMKQVARLLYTAFLFVLFFDPEDGGDMFL
jgi:hypothetical protein